LQFQRQPEPNTNTQTKIRFTSLYSMHMRHMLWRFIICT